MFIRPDWKTLEPYKRALSEHPSCIAWEFLRRNPEYQKDVDAYEIEVLEFCRASGRICDVDLGCEIDLPEHYSSMVCHHGDYSLGRWEYWCRYTENRWRLNRPILTTEDIDGTDFVVAALDRSERFAVVGLGCKIEGPLVHIPVDLSEPLDVIKKRVMWQVMRYRKEGINQGTVKPCSTRVLAPRVYVEQLRILDAVSTGATVREIGDILMPDASNDPDSRQRDKRIKAASKAALNMQNDGYRALLTSW